jgi:hypothetical protein
MAEFADALSISERTCNVLSRVLWKMDWRDTCGMSGALLLANFVLTVALKFT